jgi:tetratricopeptide (TPR) repeat protein
MSQELTPIRRALSNVPTDLKQGRHIPAATAVRDGARLFGRMTMIKNEAEELVALLKTACEHLRYNRDIAKIFPLAINYVPGEEAALVALMNQLIEALQQSSTEDAVKQHQATKAEQFARGRKQIEDGRLDDARRTFKRIVEYYSDDWELALAVGDIFLQAEEFDDAYRYLVTAAKLRPDSAHVLNRLGMALRKMKKLDEAEVTYRRAIALAPEDANLPFNLGRVYLEKHDWQKAILCAQKALSLKKDFAEAAKLAAYAKKKADGGQ